MVLPQWKLRVAASVRRRPPRSSYESAYTDSPGKCGPLIVHFFRFSSAVNMKAPFTVPTRRRTSPEEGCLPVLGMGRRRKWEDPDFAPRWEGAQGGGAR